MSSTKNQSTQTDSFDSLFHLKLLQFQRREGRFCDVTLRPGGSSSSELDIPCHRIILCNRSVYFREEFRKTREKQLFVFENINHETLLVLVEYLYSGGRIHLTTSNVVEVCNGAKDLKLDSLEAKCMNSLPDLISMSNVLGVLKIAISRGNDYIFEMAAEFIVNCLDEEIAKELLQNMEFTMVHNILQHIYIHRKIPAEGFFKLVLAWLGTSNEENQQHSWTLLERIKFAEFTQDVRQVLRENRNFVDEAQYKALTIKIEAIMKIQQINRPEIVLEIVESKKSPSNKHPAIQNYFQTSGSISTERINKVDNNEIANVATSEPCNNVAAGKISPYRPKLNRQYPTLEYERRPTEPQVNQSQEARRQSEPQSRKRLEEVETRAKKRKTLVVEPRSIQSTLEQSCKSKDNNSKLEQNQTKDSNSKLDQNQNRDSNSKLDQNQNRDSNSKLDQNQNKMRNSKFEQTPIKDQRDQHKKQIQQPGYRRRLPFPPPPPPKISRLEDHRPATSSSSKVSYSRNIRADEKIQPGPGPRTKRPRFRHPALLFCSSGRNHDSLESMDMETKRITTLAECPNLNPGYTMLYCNDKLYFAGGVDDCSENGSGRSISSLCGKTYDLRTNIWDDLPSISINGANFNKSVILGDHLYTISGRSPGGKYRLNPASPASPAPSSSLLPQSSSQDITSVIPPLLFPRYNFSTGIIDGKIYAIGGCDYPPTENQESKKVEAYDPVKNQWEEKTSLELPRMGSAVVVFNSRLYVLGGAYHHGRSGVLSKSNLVDAYDPIRDMWEFGQRMKRNRQFFSAVARDGYIYAYGGDSNSSPTIERYDMNRSKWEIISSTSLPSGGRYDNVAVARLP